METYTRDLVKEKDIPIPVYYLEDSAFLCSFLFKIMRKFKYVPDIIVESIFAQRELQRMLTILEEVRVLEISREFQTKMVNGKQEKVLRIHIQNRNYA